MIDVRPALGRAGERARVAGGRRDREQPALRGHRATVRGVRHGGGDGHRSRAIRRRRATRAASRRSRSGSPRRSIARGEGPYRDVRFTREQTSRAALRRPAARFRQGRRARAGARQAEEALPARPRASFAIASRISCRRRTSTFERERAELLISARARRATRRRKPSCSRERDATARRGFARWLDVDRRGERADRRPRGQLRRAARDQPAALRRLRRRRATAARGRRAAVS